MVRDSTIVWFVLIVMLIFFIGFLVESHGNLSDDLNHIEVICAITDIDPFYNCNEKWVLYFYDLDDVWDQCHPESKDVFHMGIVGCATFDDERGYSAIYSNKYFENSHTGQTVLQHELDHLKCRCNFHVN